MGKKKTQKGRKASKRKNKQKIETEYKPSDIQINRRDKEIKSIVNNRVYQLRYKNLVEAASKLGITPGLIISLLSQRGYKVSGYDILTEEEFLSIKDFYLSRITNIVRSEQKKKQKENSNPIKKDRYNKSSSSNGAVGVYGRISKFGIGKIIYIRQKG